MKRIHLTVSGHVQGVGFRYFCSERANQLGLSGYARNMPDGSVQIEVQGEEGAIEKFLAHARRGPRAAEVTNVEMGPATMQWDEKLFVPR